MKIKAVSFDAAGTLLENHYRPGKFARACAEEVGVYASEADERVYQSLLRLRIEDFWRANRARERVAVDAFWLELTSDWLGQIGSDPAVAPQLVKVAQVQMTQSDRWFKVFEDVLPALNHLDSLGIPALVLSNWDRSLHDILEGKGLAGRFKRVVASLEEGFEKPDPRIFQALIKPLGLKPEEVMHIGDDVGDDFNGGMDAGFHVGWLKRLSTERTCEWTPEPRRLQMIAPRLTDFVEVISSL